jgi:hypothetical protein
LTDALTFISRTHFRPKRPIFATGTCPAVVHRAERPNREHPGKFAASSIRTTTRHADSSFTNQSHKPASAWIMG